MAGKINILIIEDSEDDALFSLHEIRKGGYDPEYKRVDTAEDMRRALSEREWDVILSDHNMPHFSSADALALLKESGNDIPFIIVSGIIGEDAAVTAMKAGASDYVRKENLKRLVPAIKRETANTARRRQQRETEEILREQQGLVTGLLSLLTGVDDTWTVINDILKKVKDFTNVEAISIRLSQGVDFPHIAHSGFSDEFIKEEWSLCSHNEAGEILRDDNGGAILECMCGVVIGGRTDPAMPFFTAHGSFWTNNSSTFLNNTEEIKIEIVNPRNKCINEGYESIALVPLRSGKNTIGLLQLNDRRPGRFTLDIIEFFEQVGMTIGIALARRLTEDEIRESEERYRSLVEYAPDAIFINYEGRVVLVNQACIRLFGANRADELLDKSPFELFHPDFHEIMRERIHRLRDLGEPVPPIQEKIVRLDGGIVDVEVLAAPFLFGGVNAIHVIIRDNTERKRFEDELQHQLKELKRWQAVMMDREDRVLDLKKEVNDLLKEAGRPIKYGGS